MKNWFKTFLLFFILGLLVYFNGLNNKFLLDDYVFLSNPVWSSAQYIKSQWDPYREQELGVVDEHKMHLYYRPLTHMVYDLSYSTFKDHFWQYHLLNLFLFVFTASLISLLIVKLTGNYQLALLTGLFYLIHPINGIMVNYISASVFSFQAICMLGTILLLLESLERENSRVFYFLSLALSFLSLFWHESGVMTLFFLLAVILLFRKETLKEKGLYLFPYFLIVSSYMVFRVFFISFNDVIIKQMNSCHLGLIEVLGNLFKVLMWYITRLFYPKGIVLLWASPILHDHVMGYACGMCLLLTLFLLLFVRFAKEKILQMAIGWIVIGFAPVYLAAFITPAIGVQIEPHWFVISSIGFFILAAFFCSFMLERAKKSGGVLLFIIIITWGSVSHANNQLWRDQITYCLYWSQQDPTLKTIYFYLADAYYRDGNLKEAKKYYGPALLGTPDDIRIYNDLGTIEYGENDLKEAELNYWKVLKINPYSSTAYNNLGVLYQHQGQWNKANAFFLEALACNPFMLETRWRLAANYSDHADYRKAVDLCRINLGLDKNDIKTLLLLIDISIKNEDYEDLRKYAVSVLGGQTDPALLTRLGVLLAQHKNPQLAMDFFKRSIQVAPDYKDAYFNAGALLGNLGHYDQALKILRLGDGIDSSDSRFNEIIAKLEALRTRE